MATNVITNTDFVPTSTADWCLNGTYDTCYQNIDLSQFIPNAAVVIKFESVTDNGGNVYLDDINITGVINTPPPVADFTASQTLVCPGQPVFFTDLSTSNPNSWVWSFTGGTPGSSSSQNPAVTYNAAGTYAVSLTVTNQAGTDTKNVNGFIIVGGGQSAVINTPTNTIICGSGSVLLNSSNTASSYQWLLNGSPITGATGNAHNATASGSYDLVVFDGGCSDTTDISIVITQVPATPAVMSTINGSTSICGTQGLLITGSGGGTYQWLRNGFPLPGGTNNTFTATQPGNYLLVVDNNGCVDTSDNPLVVVLGTMPTANFTFIVNNNTVTFTDASSNGTGWAWDYGDGNNANVQNPGPHSYSALGTFVVTQIVSNGGCSDTVTYQVTISTITSNLGLLSQDAIEVYPNPVGNTLNVQIGDEGGEEVAITLLDATGKVVFNQKVNDRQMHALNVSTLPKGLYVLRLQVGNRVTDKKLVKE
jgi:PKD repeat protein